MKIFIGSSSTSDSMMHCGRIADMLEKLGHEPVLWSAKETFTPSEVTWYALVEKFKTVQAGVFIIAPDDCLIETKDDGSTESKKVAKYNVWVELACMAGQKGVTNAVIFKTVKDVDIPTDFGGITYIENGYTCQENLVAWIENIKPSIAPPNIFISSRDEVDLLTDQFRGAFSSEYAKNVKLIRMMNIVPTTFFFPDRAEPKYDAVFEQNAPFNFLKTALQNGAKIEIIVNAPTKEMMQDASHKLGVSYGGDRNGDELRYLFYKTNLTIREYISNGGDEILASAYLKGSLTVRWIDIALPCGLFEICYKEGSAYVNNDFIKVDIYSLNLDFEPKRRSMVFFKATDRYNFEFFERSFTGTYGKLMSNSEVETLFKDIKLPIA